jgi:hypothetical protein
MRKFLTTGLGAAVALATLAGAAALPATASAQDYGYDQCRRDNSNRGLAGGAIGGLAGGVIGNQASARGRHTENTLLGMAIGGIAGALIGRGDTSCPPPRDYAYDDTRPPAPPPAPAPARAYDDRAYDNRGYDRAAADRAYDQGYDRGYADSRYDDAYYAPPPPPVVYVAPPRRVYGPSVYFGFGGGRRW